MTKIPQPHDRFLKELLSHPARAGALLREHLPGEVARFLSDKPPELVDASFVDEELDGHLSDRLYKVETSDSRTAFLYVLIEHKSSPDRKIGLQLLRYLAEILKQWEKENPKWKRLPAIVPFVFYHGFSKWRLPNEFLHLVDAEASWRPYLLNFRFPVLDLGKIPDKQLSQDPRLYAWLLVMKYATRGREQRRIRELLVEALRGVAEDLRPILYYLVQTYVYDEQTLRRIIRAVRPEEEATMMSQFAQDITRVARQEALREGMQQGLQRGHREGRLEGRLEGHLEGLREGEAKGEAKGEVKGEAKLLLRQLSRRFQPLPEGISERIYGADPDTIETWADRVLDAKSLDEVFMG